MSDKIADMLGFSNNILVGLSDRLNNPDKYAKPVEPSPVTKLAEALAVHSAAEIEKALEKRGLVLLTEADLNDKLQDAYERGVDAGSYSDW